MTAVPITQSEVAAQDRDPEWVAYHNLVIDEARGCCSSCTADRLAEDPYRWAAHLGCAIGDLSDRIDLLRHEDPRHRSGRHLRLQLVSRKGDVVAIRKRTALAHRTAHANGRWMQHTYALRLILEQIDEIDMDGTVLDRISAIAADALGTSLDDTRPATEETPMRETASEAQARVVGPLIDEIGLLAALAAPCELQPGNMVKVAGEWAAVAGVEPDGRLRLTSGDPAIERFYTPTTGERFVWHEGAF